MMIYYLSKCQISEEESSFSVCFNLFCVCALLFYLFRFRSGFVERTISRFAIKLYTMHFLIIMFQFKGLIKMSGLSIWMVFASVDPLQGIENKIRSKIQEIYFSIRSVIKDNTLSNNLYIFQKKCTRESDREGKRDTGRVWELPGFFATDELFRR